MTRRGILPFLLAAVLSPPAGSQEGVEHRVPPGYEPEQSNDEKGLWLEVEEYEKAVQQSALLVKDPDINNYVDAIVCRVAGDYCRDLRVYVIRNPGFNASMTASGMLQIWTGLLLRAQTQDEVAAVIGHEIAHYTRLHTLERLRNVSKSSSTGLILDLGIAALTGYGLPVGQLGAMLNRLAFSREQEREADFLGTRMLAEAAFDPHAAYRIWENLIAEEDAAVVKHEQPGVFSMTHPAAEERAARLEEWVTSTYGPADFELVPTDAHLDFLNEHYLYLMEDQIDTNRYGRTRALLERHTAIGIEPSLVHYFYGEMFRQSDEPGDEELAMDAYRHAIEGHAAPAAAFRNLGYLYLKHDRLAEAQAEFRRYLEAAPDASDRVMIEFYLEEPR